MLRLRLLWALRLAVASSEREPRLEFLNCVLVGVSRLS